jgi:succinate-semialdehyde dehydrogenase/glutarate-semialdehyde dehydrogenase
MNNRLYIGGSWRSCDGRDRITVTNPATGEVIGDIPNAGAEEMREAIEAAYKAFPAWSATPAPDRSRIMKKFYDLMMEHEEELARIITLEMGKPLQEAKGEVAYAASYVEWYAEEAKRLYGETIPSNHKDKRMLVMRQPVGVVAAITPWNFPAAMITRKMAPALAAGCTIVIKPSELTPFTAIKLMELAEMAGLPAGTVNLVTGDPSAIGGEIMANQKVRKVSFTGSTNIGKLLMKQGSEQMKKLSLELGGHAPIIVLDDADLDKAVKGVIGSKFRNAGQACICGNRVYVQSGIYEDFLDKLVKAASELNVGNGMSPGVDIGPLINKQAYEKVDRQVKDALSQGAVCRLGGEGTTEQGAYFYRPTILSESEHCMSVMTEETFGPVAPIKKVETAEEAVRLANDTQFGLAAYVFSENLTRGLQVVESLEYGIIGWNDGLPSAAQAPFGGMKESGTGREGGREGIEGFLETKYVSIGL